LNRFAGNASADRLLKPVAFLCFRTANSYSGYALPCYGFVVKGMPTVGTSLDAARWIDFIELSDRPHVPIRDGDRAKRSEKPDHL